MLKQVKLFFYAFMASAAILGCAGEDGDPGAKGDTGEHGQQGAPGNDAAIKIGLIEGTIEGTRRDGTAIDQDFKFEFVYGSESLDADSYIDFYRFGTAGEAIAHAANFDAPAENFAALGGYIDGDFLMETFNFGFTKELSSTKLFRLTTEAFTRPFNYNNLLLALSVEENGVYDFDMNANALVIYQADYDGDKTDENVLTVTTGVNWMSVGYNAATGDLVYVTLNDAELLTEGEIFDKYNAIKLTYNGDLKDYAFVRASDDAPLHDIVGQVPGDEVVISNYTNLNGVISFDFVINISKYRGVLGEMLWGFQYHGKNSTAHDLTISGHFTSGQKVYSSVVGRVAGE
jgi:hypothetical protein